MGQTVSPGLPARSAASAKLNGQATFTMPTSKAIPIISERTGPETRALDFLFTPRSVAVIGATEKPGSVGRSILWNLISSPFGGTVYPVNPKRSSVLGIKAYPSVAELPERVELAVVITPAATVPGIVRECGEAGVRGAIVISAGFRESGAAGALLEQEVLTEARRFGMRVVGPNCLGIMRPVTGFNATFAPTIARRGNVALPQPERSSLHRRARLEPARADRLQRISFHWLDGRRRLGQSHRLLR